MTREEYRKQIRKLRLVLEGKKDRLIAEMEQEMQEASTALLFEKAARLRDDIEALKKLGQRGDAVRDVQPEVFPIDPKKGLLGLRKVLGLEKTPRTIEGVDIAHLGGGETVASLVHFIDGLPFKPGYRRYPHPIGARRRRLRLDPRGGDAPLPPVVARGGDVPRHSAHRRRQGPTQRGLGGVSAAGRGTADADLAGQARGRDLPARRRRSRCVSAGTRRRCGCCSTCATRRTASRSTIITFCGGRSWR